MGAGSGPSISVRACRLFCLGSSRQVPISIASSSSALAALPYQSILARWNLYHRARHEKTPVDLYSQYKQSDCNLFIVFIVFSVPGKDCTRRAPHFLAPNWLLQFWAELAGKRGNSCTTRHAKIGVHPSFFSARACRMVRSKLRRASAMSIRLSINAMRPRRSGLSPGRSGARFESGRRMLKPSGARFESGRRMLKPAGARFESGPSGCWAHSLPTRRR